MSAAKGQGKTLWIAIGLTAGVLVLAVFAAMRIKPPKSPAAQPRKTPDASVVITRLNANSAYSALDQQAALSDSSPLFLPTAVNGSDPGLPATLRREPGAAFHAFPARYAFAEYEMKVVFPEPIPMPQDLMEALKTGETRNPFFTIGRLNYAYKPLTPRSAFIEVVQAGTGRTVLSAPLAAPGSELLLADDWKPLEFIAAVDAVGLVGDPAVTSGSGSERVDNLFRDLIAKKFRLGERLRPGFYAVRIGP